jgi:uncharacterized protein YkwD
MERTIHIVLVCAALGGCAAGGLPSFSSLGSVSEPDRPKAAAAAPAAPAPERAAEPAQNNSTLGSIWSNFSSAFSSGAQPVAQKISAPEALDANEALRLINDFRATKSLPPLSLDGHASAAAQTLAKEMAHRDRMSANSLDLGKRLLTAGYSYTLAAENVSAGQASIEDTIEGWKKRPDNSRNMLLPTAKHIGIAYEYKADTTHKTFWALIVAAP